MRKILCVLLITIILISNCIYIYAENVTPTEQSLNKINTENQTSGDNNENSTENNNENNTENANEKKTLEQLQQENKELQEQIESSSLDLGIVTEELSENLIQVQELDEKITQSEGELEVLNGQITILNRQVKENETKLEKIKEEYETNQKLADERLIIMYESGDIQYLDVLLGSNSIIDFISNYYLITQLHEYDFQVLEEIENQKKEQERITQQLETQKQELSEKRLTQQKYAQMLENTKAAREFYISKLTEEEQNIQNQITEYKTQVLAIENEIRSLAKTASFGENYTGGEMIWPVPGYYRITSPYGMRTHPVTGIYKLHTGVDVSAPMGTNFVAMADGVVVKAQYSPSYGNMVILDHGGGVQTLYAHGSEIVVQLGDQVKQGDVVLKSGSTGYSTGPHCHFEVRLDGKTTNPLDYVSP